MRTIRDKLFAAAAAIALVATPVALATVDAGHAQGKSGESQGAAGEAGGGHGVASEAGGNPGGLGAGRQDGTASSLGRLNATNASPQALENAAPNSVPGQLRTYRDALAIDDFEGAAGALSSAANKSLTIDEVREVNSRLGIVLTTEEEAALLEQLD